MTLEVNRLLVKLSTGMGSPPFEFIYRIVGLEVPSPLAREVTERLALLWDIHRERDEEKRKAAERNGTGNGQLQGQDQREVTQR